MMEKNVIGGKLMTREEFCNVFWNYYLILEKDFLKTERYVTLDLGDNNLYDGNVPTNPANSYVFSVEYVKQYQAICSEIDVILKAICRELQSNHEKMDQYAKTILNDTFWKQITSQKVLLRNIELQPFINWSDNPYKAPDWWRPYNGVKHDRAEKYKEANLKNVLNALAGLYTLEIYLVKYIGNRDNEKDVPNDISELFSLKDWETRETVIGKDTYVATSQDIESLFQ